jgi:hypothetical protein
MQWYECNNHNYLCINVSLKFLFCCKNQGVTHCRLHRRGTVQHYRCYSDTRGVTVTGTLNQFLNPQLSPKTRTNQVTKVLNQNLMNRLKIQTPTTVVLMAQYMTFGNFMKLILPLIPKYHFILMTWSAIIQIYKKKQCQKEIVSKAQNS